MEKSTQQIEKNVSASFGYVKKDMLMLNDAFSDIHDKVQHLSLNHAMLLEEIGRLRSELAKATGGKIVKKTIEKNPKKLIKTKTIKNVDKKAKKVDKKITKKVVAKKIPKKVIKTEEIVYS